METIVVTGGSGGIGRGLCRQFGGAGHRVVNIDREKPDALEHGEVFIDADLGDVQGLATCLSRIVDQYGPTRLVANAATGRPASVDGTTLEDFDRAMAINVRATMQCAQALLPTMRQRGFGRIVVISSRAALGKVDRLAYSTSKAALHGMVRTMALELGRDGITVNAVAPGPIDTAAFRRANPEGSPARERIEAGTAVRRMGKPEDIANAVSFLLDDTSGFITGQILHVCGGLSVGISR